MDDAQRYTEVVVHESGHAVVATYFSGQIKEVTAIPNGDYAGYCSYVIGFGTSQEDKDTIAAAGRTASEMWNARYTAGWNKDEIRQGAASDWNGIEGSPFQAQRRAQAILTENWDDLSDWVEKLYAAGTIVNGLGEEDGN